MHPQFVVSGQSFSSYIAAVACGAFAAALLLFVLTRRRYKYDIPELIIQACVCAVACFIGAKLLYLALYPKTAGLVKTDPLSFFSGGFSFYGGLICAVAACVTVSLAKKQSVPRALDTFMPSFALLHGFARVGCHLAGCCYGCVTESGFGVVFPGQSVARLPVQLAEAAFLLLLCIVLCAALFLQKSPGLVCCIYMLGYGIWRFFIDFLRADDPGARIIGLSIAQVFSLLLAVGGAVWIVLRRRRLNEKV